MILSSVILLFAFYVGWIKWIYHRYHRTSVMSGILSNYPEHKRGFRDVQETSLALDSGRALFVIAHPDDECMFFSPSIIMLLKQNVSVQLLCLSSGNYYNQGVQRKKELLDSAAVLGIAASQVFIIEHKDLQDDPKAEWSISLTSNLILRHIQTHSINVVLTFDGSGVSGHANHIAIYKALSHLAVTGKVPHDCHVLVLNTISIFRKYFSILELPISWLIPSDLCCILGSKEYKQAKRAMFCHRSQLLWFRHLYILFSRYMFVNTFQDIPLSRKDIKVY
ncbi:N-acetylglucosaminyl-phosphatidylinositol de-N-acetylase [Alosa pseudoharengus]|uniref:N-acetylglucosaminyl-phosphatidylinositol de-N-acetylase n=1 Tax=Alosa pseudoharengus TaxID=34774 RepID=UPI003F8CC3A0